MATMPTAGWGWSWEPRAPAAFPRWVAGAILCCSSGILSWCWISEQPGCELLLWGRMVVLQGADPEIIAHWHQDHNTVLHFHFTFAFKNFWLHFHVKAQNCVYFIFQTHEWGLILAVWLFCVAFPYKHTQSCVLCFSFQCESLVQTWALFCRSLG